MARRSIKATSPVMMLPPSRFYEAQALSFLVSQFATITQFHSYHLEGKTTTSEFTWTNSGPNTTNPHDPNRTPGGSSAGSAAAVADFQVPFSIGTQTSRSVIPQKSTNGTR